MNRHAGVCLKLSVALFLALTLASASFATATAGELTVRITQSGTLYVEEPVSIASITLAIPQTTQDQIIRKLSTKPDTAVSQLVKDSGGSSMLKMQWSDLQTGTYNYSVETVLTLSSRAVPKVYIGADNSWISETAHVQLTDRIRELAWRYREADIDAVAQLTVLAHSMLTYDRTIKPRTTQAVLQTGRGDATAHAILLAALLRAAGVPTRIVIGDAPIDEERISDSAWVEVLATDEGNNIWIPFDATFLRGGSLDDYIVKWVGDDLPSERLEFIGDGNASWKQNPDTVEIINSKPASLLSITPSAPTVMFPKNLYGWFGATLQPTGCGFWHLSPISCKDTNNQPLLNFHDAERVIWNCDATDVLWVFDITGSNYVCPIRLQEATGVSAIIDATINSGASTRSLSIEGLDVVAAGDSFDLVAMGIDLDRMSDMIFYSPTLNARSSERVWILKLDPGVYDFYLWFDGSLATKRVRAIEQRAFTIALSSPASAAIDERIPIRIDITNLLEDWTISAEIKLKANNIPVPLCWKPDSSTVYCDSGRTISPLDPGESRTLEFTTVLDMPGAITLTASAEQYGIESATFVSKPIEIVMPPIKQLERTLLFLEESIGKVLRILSKFSLYRIA